ncbi:hypothetical protein E3983_00075 [Legionella israelensis]|uniref:Site-specific DNA-methyltransferase (cytosine-N(4)-specific) n=1 Tax=Legionella israelensis TaxID=454 RepID=A0AAX1ECY5_9GAMM|nr:hypothetical protein [Legionella israelensis]QBR82894.1 hypothetical protein E3983_00075 [Legionella israelensis]
MPTFNLFDVNSQEKQQVLKKLKAESPNSEIPEKSPPKDVDDNYLESLLFGDGSQESTSKHTSTKNTLESLEEEIGWQLSSQEFVPYQPQITMPYQPQIVKPSQQSIPNFPNKTRKAKKQAKPKKILFEENSIPDTVTFYGADITLDVIKDIAAKNHLDDEAAALVMTLLAHNFNNNSQHFIKNGVSITHPDIFILALLKVVASGYKKCQDKYAFSGSLKTFNFDSADYKELHKKFIMDIQYTVKFGNDTNAERQSDTRTTLFKRAFAWSVIMFFKSKSIDGFPLEFYKPTLTEANKSFDKLLRKAEALFKETKKPDTKLTPPDISDIETYTEPTSPTNFHASPAGQKTSGFFTTDQRSATAKEKYSPKDRWQKAPQHFTIWLSKEIELDKNLQPSDIKRALSRNAFVCQFDPYSVIEAANLLVKNGYVSSVKRIFDPIGGWGDRLVGALAYFLGNGSPDPSVIVSNDANPVLKENYVQIFEHMKKQYPLDKVTFKAFNSAIENLDLDDIFKITGNMRFDMAITSPPYYDTDKGCVIENYPRHDSESKTQQSSQYPNATDWTIKFYHPFIRKVLASSWHFFLNVPMDSDLHKQYGFLADSIEAKPKKQKNAEKPEKSHANHKPDKYFYFKETTKAMEEYETQTGYMPRIIFIGSYPVGTTYHEAMYGIKVYVPLTLPRQPQLQDSSEEQHTDDSKKKTTGLHANGFFNRRDINNNNSNNHEKSVLSNVMMNF